MNIIRDTLFDIEIALEKASYTAENLSEDLTDFLKVVKDQIGGNGDKFNVGMSIILDYLGEVRGNLEITKEALTKIENQGKKES